MKNGVTTKELEPAREFIKYLEELEVGFVGNDPKLFPKKSRAFYSSKVFENAVLEIDCSTNITVVQNFIEQLIKINVTALSISFIDFREDILRLLNELTVKSGTRRVDIFVNVPDLATFGAIESIAARNGRFVIYYYSEQGTLDWNKNFAAVDISTAVTAERVAEPSVVLNARTYHEGLQYNTGLNRKISLTKYGRIKNHPTHSVDFGSPTEFEIETLVDNPSFTQLWKLNNDNIEHCKSCVLRYNCISNTEVKLVGGKYYKERYCDFIKIGINN